MRALHRVLLIAIVSATLAACSRSNAQTSQGLPPEVERAALDWSKCRSSKVNSLRASERSAEDIVDYAIRECSSFELEMTRVWKAAYGPNSGSQVIALHERIRQGLIDLINSERWSTAAVEPTGAWGQCVGRNLPAVVPIDATASSLAERAMNACLPEAERVRTDIARKYGDASAASDSERMRASLRALAIAEIEARRQAQ